MILSIVIPAYNEEDTIKEIVQKVISLSGIEKEIIIVDDCSKDGTKHLITELQALYPSIKTFLKPQNQGKGAALRDGFKLTTGDLVIVQDADMEYEPNEYIKLISAVEKDTVIYGSRFQKKVDAIYTTHFLGNKLLTSFTNLLFGTNLTDMETCYKLLPGDFARSVDIKSDRFNFEPEITARILKAGYKIKEVPISYRGRKFSEGKKITWKDGFSAIYTLIKFRFF